MSESRNQMPDQYKRDGEHEIVRRPADAASSPEEQPAGGTNAPKPEQPAARSLSDTGIDYNGHGTLVLYYVDGDDEAPVRIETVIERWKALPKAQRFDPLSFDCAVVCYDKQTGKIAPNVVPPDNLIQTIVSGQEEKIRQHMAKLTGEKPVEASTGPVTIDALNKMSKEALFDLFYEMKKPDRQRVIDAVMAANKKRVTEANAKRQQGGSDHSGDKPAEPAPAPQPKAQPKQPPKQQSTPQNTRRRYAGW